MKILKSFSFALKGLVVAWKEELNFRLETLVSLGVIFSMFYFDFSMTEKIFCIFAITLVLSAEILNTAIEDLCNKVEPNTDPLIGKVKDMSSAFVLVAGFGSFLVGVLVFLNHFRI